METWYQYMGSGGTTRTRRDAGPRSSCVQSAVTSRLLDLCPHSRITPGVNGIAIQTSVETISRPHSPPVAQSPDWKGVCVDAMSIHPLRLSLNHGTNSVSMDKTVGKAK